MITLYWMGWILRRSIPIFLIRCSTMGPITPKTGTDRLGEEYSVSPAGPRVHRRWRGSFFFVVI